MAGRPRTMAKRVTALEDRALQLTDDLLKIVPSQYLGHPNDGDPFNAAWNRAVDRVHDSMYAFAGLGNLVREKAGIVEPGPVALFWAEREGSEEPAICDGEGI